MAVIGFGSRSQITIWDLATRKKTFDLSHPTQVASMQFSLDSKTLVSMSHDASLRLETLKLWDVDMGRELGSLDLSPATVQNRKSLNRAVSISSDGKILAVSSPQTGEAALFDLPSLKQLTTVKETAPSSIQFSLNSKMVAILDLSRTAGNPAFIIQLFDIENHRVLDVNSFQNQGGPLSIGFSPDSQLLLSGCMDGNVRLWDVANGKLKATMAGTMNEALAVPTAFNPDGKSIAVGTGGSIKIWDISAYSGPP